MMTFEEAIEFYNEQRCSNVADMAFAAVLQKVCDLEARLDLEKVLILDLEGLVAQLETRLDLMADYVDML